MNKLKNLKEDKVADVPKSFFDLEISDLTTLEDTLKLHKIEYNLLSQCKVGERTHYLCRIYCSDLKKSFWLGMAYNMNRSKKFN